MQDVVASRAPLSSSSVEIWGAWLGQPSRLTGPPGWDSIRAEPFAQAHRSSVRRMSDGRKPGQALVRNGPERTEGLSNTFADTASMLCRDEEEVRQAGLFVGDKPRIISEGEHNSRDLLHRAFASRTRNAILSFQNVRHDDPLRQGDLFERQRGMDRVVARSEPFTGRNVISSSG